MIATPATGRSFDAFDAALRAEPLRALDARGRADVRASAKLRRVAAGSVVVHAGEPADTLFVVAIGSVRLEDTGHVVRAGELFGHEALVPFAVRGARAVAAESSSVVELPAGVFKRVLVRAGLGELAVREETRARRAEWLALLGRTALAVLPPLELEALARALVETPRDGGEALEPAPHETGLWLVAGGLFELGSGIGGPARAVYAARGDFIGHATARAGAARTAARALGPALALRIPSETLARFAERRPDALAAVERVTSAREAKQRRTLDAARRSVTRHAADEMERLGSAGSLLAIDLERCTRCGHCTATCADSHGTPRLERRGEKIVVTLRTDDAVATAPLLLPSACQHCREPACLDPCPTGAIRRLATGAVELDHDLCTGCGACAKACPWDAIRMAPRSPSAGSSAAGSAEVAVKCDLCRAHDGPECVSACPTDAIFRLEPARDVLEVRAAVGEKDRAPRSAARGHRTLARGLLSFALIPPFVALDRALPAGAGHGARLVAGALAAVLVAVLAAHAVVKRVARVRRWARRALARSGSVSTVSPFVSFHAASGVAAAACVLLHAGMRVPAGLAGTLVLAFWSVAASGVFGAVVYRVLPERLTRVERRSRLPEDEPEEREALLDRLHAAVSGANPAKKELVRRNPLLPYAAAWGGTLSLAFSGRTLAEEEAALGARLEHALGGRKSERLAGVEGLVRTAVEMRALRTQRLLRVLLRAWLPLHLVLSALVVAALALHAVGVLR